MCGINIIAFDSICVFMEDRDGGGNRVIGLYRPKACVRSKLFPDTRQYLCSTSTNCTVGFVPAEFRGFCRGGWMRLFGHSLAQQALKIDTR